jgi:hypothetical protein
VKKKLLKDTLPFVTPKQGSAKFISDLQRRPDGISIFLLAPQEVTWKVTPQRAKASDVAKLTAHKFVDLMKSGLKPGEAAHRLHTSVRNIMQNSSSRKVVKDVIEEFTYDASVRKLLQRALVNKTAVENADEKGDKKLLLEALKLMADDSELEIKKPVALLGGPVTISTSLQEVLDAMPDAPEPIDTPELPEPDAQQ